jgi:hypothetical protein
VNPRRLLIGACAAVVVAGASSLGGFAWTVADAAASGTSGDIHSPQPLSNADRNTGGANGGCLASPTGIYCSTRSGAPSLNGNGNGNASGKPCAACVGRADNKNPPGQEKSNPMGVFPNNGYECDHNNGIGKSNPAHTGCSALTPTTPSSTPPTTPESTPPTTPSSTPPTTPSSTPPTTPGSTPPTTPGESVLPTSSTLSPTQGATVLPTQTSLAPASSASTPAEVLGEQQTRTPSSNSGLPFTGALIAPLLAVGILAAGVGTALVLSTRRRRDT